VSLFSQIAETLANKSLANAVGGGINGALSGINNGIAQALGNGAFGRTVANLGTGIASSAATGLINSYSPVNQQAFNAATGAIGDIMSGDFDAAGLRLLDSGLIDRFLPNASGVAAQARFWGTPTPLFGGLSPAEAKIIYDQALSTRYSKKNLFLIEVSSALFDDISSRFNLFAVDLEFAPYIISGEKKKIGAAHADLVNSSDPVELRVTTFDDETGFLKTWFATHAQKTAAHDGTVGLPAEYAITIKIVHSYLSRDTGFRGYEDAGLYRVANIDHSLSRRDDNLQELQMTFVQLDTFMSP
jgi:hypothetical protein